MSNAAFNPEFPRSATTRDDSGPPPRLRALPESIDQSQLHEAAWASIITDPMTGVAIISSDGRTLWANDQIARIVHGDNATGAQYTGTDWEDLYPREWIDERLELMRQVRETGKPILLRTIWRGHQLLSWIHYIPKEEEDDSPDRFLVITRRIGTANEKQLEAIKAGATVVESNVASLGDLEPLTNRELEVLALLGQGLSIKEIASALHRSAKTIENHRSSIGRKLNLDDRVQLAELACRAGLMTRDADRKRV
jgi:DNA-binding CsgD family transcriptional regulator